MTESGITVGECLQRAREQAGLTVDEVADAVKVRASIIERIESNDFSLCGGVVYAKGHLRQMARVIGVDPDDVIAQVNWSQWE